MNDITLSCNIRVAISGVVNGIAVDGFKNEEKLRGLTGNAELIIRHGTE